MARAVVALAGNPPWGDRVAAQLRQWDYAPARYRRRKGYVARLADARAALLLVDGDGDDWQAWAVLPKANQATRRIPVVVVTRDPARQALALDAGSQATVSPEELLAQLPDMLATLARVRSEDEQARLLAQCGEPLPPRALEGIEKFNAGEFYRQHDLFEAQWMDEEGPVRDLYQAILQVGVAYYQITRGNHRGALKMLLRSTQWLLALPDVCQGVDVRQLREDAMRVRAELEKMDPAGIGEFDRALLRPVRMAAVR